MGHYDECYEHDRKMQLKEELNNIACGFSDAPTMAWCNLRLGCYSDLFKELLVVCPECRGEAETEGKLCITCLNKNVVLTDAGKLIASLFKQEMSQ